MIEKTGVLCNFVNANVSSYILKTMRFLAFFLFIGLYSFGQPHKAQTINPKAKQLVDSAMRSAIETGSCEEALVSNYVMPVRAKLSCLIGLKRYSNALLVAKKLDSIELDFHPPFPRASSLIAIIYEKLADTVNSKFYFIESLNQVERTLDTMSKENKAYDYVLMEKGIVLLLLNEQEKGDAVIRYLSEIQKKDIINYQSAFFLNKTREAIIRRYFNFN